MSSVVASTFHAGLILPRTPAVTSGADSATLTWGPRSSDPVRVLTVPGGHHSMLTGPGLQHITDALRDTYRGATGGW